MTQFVEGHLASADGLPLYYRAWHPEGDPAGTVMLIHGLAEHIGRYDYLANALTAANYAVYAVDLRGHGRSGGKRSFVREYDEFMSDLERFAALVNTEHPHLPMVVLGHSMGGHLALGYTLRFPTRVAGLALSGPALKAGSDITPFKQLLLRVLARVAPGLRPEGLNADAVSRDPAVVAAYKADPLVYSGKVSAGLGNALLTEMDTFPDRYAELSMPVIVMHGTADELTDPAGSRELAAGATNTTVTSHFYEGLFHEIFNEPERDDVIADLVTWLKALPQPTR